MVAAKWVSGTGLVLNMNPTVANIIVDVLLTVMSLMTASLASHALMELRKMAIIRGGKRNLPLGRFEFYEVIKEWIVIRSGNQHGAVYVTVVVMSILMMLAHPIADSGLTFNNHEMGEEVRITKYYLRDVREGIGFRRSAQPGEWKGLTLEADILERSQVDDIGLYKKALHTSLVFNDIFNKDPGANGTIIYPAVLEAAPGENLELVPGAQKIRSSWRRADWLVGSLHNLEINVTRKELDQNQVRFYIHEIDIKINLLEERGYNDFNECLVETMGSPVPGIAGTFFLCRSIRSPQLHHYIAALVVCAEDFSPEKQSFRLCAELPGLGTLSEFEEHVQEGTLSPVPLQILGSYIGMAGVRRLPGQTFLGSSLHAIVAARFFSARQQEVVRRNSITRPEIRVHLFVTLGVYLLSMLGTVLWTWTYFIRLKRIDCKVAIAHVPSYAYEWALKARNEKLQEWPSAEAKPKDVIVSSFFGIVQLEGDTDYLGITASPKPSNFKPFGILHSNQCAQNEDSRKSPAEVMY